MQQNQRQVFSIQCNPLPCETCCLHLPTIQPDWWKFSQRLRGFTVVEAYVTFSKL